MTDRKRSFLDRALALVQPSPDASFRPPPREIAPGLWEVCRAVIMPPAMRLPIRMTILRLPSGGLLVHSPVELDSETSRAVRELGEVKALLAPNSFHHVFVSRAAEEFPRASLFLAPGLPERVPSLPKGRIVTDVAPPEWAGAIEPLVFGVKSFVEVVLLHRPTKTLILTDLAFFWPRIEGLYNRLAWRAFGMPSRFGTSRTARLTLLRDRAAAAPFLKRIEAWEFERIMVAHGDVLEKDAKAEFRRAYASYLA